MIIVIVITIIIVIIVIIIIIIMRGVAAHCIGSHSLWLSIHHQCMVIGQ